MTTLTNIKKEKLNLDIVFHLHKKTQEVETNMTLTSKEIKQRKKLVLKVFSVS